MNKKALIIISSVLGILIFVFAAPFLFGGLFKGSNTSTQTAQKQVYNLVFWNLFDEQNLYEGAMQDFSSRFSNVRVSYKKYTDVKEYESDFVNALAEGKGPDIIAIQPSWLLKHKPKLRPMPLDAQKFPLSVLDVYKSRFLDVASKDLIVKEANTQGVIQDRVYAVPISMDSLGLIYNKDLLRRNNAKNVPAETWDEFVTDVRTQTKKTASNGQLIKGGVAMGRIDNVTRGVDILNLLMLQRGARFYDPTMQEVTMANSVFLNGKSNYPVQDAFDFYASFAKNSTNNYAWDLNLTENFPKDKDLGAFARGEVPFIFGYGYQINDIKRLINQYRSTAAASVISADDIRIAPVPRLLPAENAKDDTAVALATYFPLAVTRTSKIPDTAWQFISMLTEVDQQRFLFQQGKKLSSTLELSAEQERDLVFGALARQNLNAQSLLTPDIDGMSSVYAAGMIELLAGRKDAKEVATGIQAALQCMLDKSNGKIADSEKNCTD